MERRPQECDTRNIWTRFSDIYSPANLAYFTRNEERCLFGKAPTLISLKDQSIASDELLLTWVQTFVANVNEFTSVRLKITQQQLREISEILYYNYAYLKASEIMLFFSKFKRGDYGKLYGCVDPLEITSSFRQFVMDRNNKVYEHERKETLEREQRRDAAKKIINPLEHPELFPNICKSIREGGGRTMEKGPSSFIHKPKISNTKLKLAAQIIELANKCNPK